MLTLPSLHRKGAFLLVKIAFLLSSLELQGWIEGESQSYPYTPVFDAGKPVDAYVVLAEREGDEQFLAQIPEGKPFAWYGEYTELAAKRNPRLIDGDWESFTGETLIEAARIMAEEIEAQKKTARRPKLKKATDEISRESEEIPIEAQEESLKTHPEESPKLRFAWHSRKNEHHPEEQEETDEHVNVMKPAVVPRAIAVGGVRGSGASFVAWNLAAVAGLPVIEGRATGALSIWTGDQTPVAQALQAGSQYGTVLEGELPKEILTHRVIVDVGDDWNHPVFQRAAIRIWVTSLDPATIFVPSVPCSVVVNRVPEWMALDLREIVKTDVALQVPDGGWEALLSLYTHVPWILKQSQDTKHAWQRLIEPTRTKEEQAWDIGW